MTRVGVDAGVAAARGGAAAGGAPAASTPVRANRGPGRPRNDAHDERILAAVVEIIDRGEDVTVSRLVELSGVSRAAIYRRWPSTTDLLAAALDHGRVPYGISLDGDLLENVVHTFTSGGASGAGAGYSDERFRLRLRLALSDPKLAQAYWRSHVARRREGLAAVLREGIARGELRGDLDLDACMDLMTGVFYYQAVVRGDGFDDPATQARCAEALRVVWRGMAR